MKLFKKLNYRGFGHLELLTAVMVVGLVVVLGGYIYAHIYGHADSTGMSIVASSGTGSNETYIEACQTLISSDVGKIYKVTIQYDKPASDSGFYGYSVKDGQTKTNRNSKTGSNYTGNVSAQLTANASQTAGDYLSVFEINNGVITSNTDVSPALLSSCPASASSTTTVTNLPSAAPQTTQNKTSAALAAQQLEATKRAPSKQLPTPQNAPTHLSGAASSTGSIQYSAIWSGYVATPNSGTFTSTVGYMIVPTVTCGPNDANNEVFEWTGLDGWGGAGDGNTVEQDGIGAVCDIDNNTLPEYDAWYEMWPQDPDVIVYQTGGNYFTASSGDVLEMGVQFKNGEYTMTVTDLTTNQSASATEACNHSGGCLNGTAEWISELPSGTAGNGLLPQYTPTVFGYNEANDGAGNQGISDFPNNPIFMYDSSGDTLATVSTNLCLGGTGFYDYWQAEQ